MSSRTFAELYCERHALSPEQFSSAVLRRCLYPHARLLAPLLDVFASDFFSADRDLVAGAGALRRSRDFKIEVQDFMHHPANQGGFRKLLRLRVSTQRLARLVRSTLRSGDSEEDREAGAA